MIGRMHALQQLQRVRTEMSNIIRKPGRIAGILKALALAALVLGAGYMLSANLHVDKPWLFFAVMVGFVSCAPGLWRRRSR